MNNEEVGLASSVPWHVQEENVVIRYRHNGRIPLSLEVGIIKVLPFVSRRLSLILIAHVELIQFSGWRQRDCAIRVVSIALGAYL